jgi:hypothetical protein
LPHDGNVPISADHDFSATDSKAADAAIGKREKVSLP